MVRVLSLVALAAAAVVAAVTPAVAVPTTLAQRAMTPASPSAAAAASMVSAMRGAASVRKEQAGEGLPDLKELAVSALEPLWEAYKAGEYDEEIAAFKAGEFDEYLPSEEEILTSLEQVYKFIRKTVPKVFKLLDEVKAGKHDEFLEESKEGSLEDFMLAVGNALIGEFL